MTSLKFHQRQKNCVGLMERAIQNVGRKRPETVFEGRTHEDKGACEGLCDRTEI